MVVDADMSMLKFLVCHQKILLSPLIVLLELLSPVQVFPQNLQLNIQLPLDLFVRLLALHGVGVLGLLICSMMIIMSVILMMLGHLIFLYALLLLLVIAREGKVALTFMGTNVLSVRNSVCIPLGLKREKCT